MKNTCSRFKSLHFLAALILLVLIGCGSGAGENENGADGGQSPGTTVRSLSIAWDPPTTRTNGDPLAPDDITGYKVYYGTSSGGYTESFDAGNVLSFTIADLPVGSSYFIVVTAMDANRNESAFSSELSGTI